MASTRTKATYDKNDVDNKIEINFKNKADYVLVDISLRNVYISFTYNDLPYDEIVTFKLNHDINFKDSKYVFNRDTDKLLQITLIKTELDFTYNLDAEHKFIEKRNHPKADPRGFQVKKPAKKDWDKVIASLDDESDSEQDANQALKKIYDGCDDDTRRAMEKSLYESQGTVLNMNWGEVGKEKILPYDSAREEAKFKERGFRKD